MNVITNKAGECLVLVRQDGSMIFHHDPKFAKPYRTLRGARCAATVFKKRCDMPLVAAPVQQGRR